MPKICFELLILLLLSTACSDPMVFFNCSSTSTGEKGAECQKSCLTLETECVRLKCWFITAVNLLCHLQKLHCFNMMSWQMSTQCTSGCVCPDGLLSDGNGGCVKEEDCPCAHNGELHNPGQTITVNCNTWWVRTCLGEIEFLEV